MENKLVVIEKGRFVLHDVPGDFETNARVLCWQALHNNLIEFSRPARPKVLDAARKDTSALPPWR